MNRIKFYTINDEYISYLRQFDNKVFDNKNPKDRNFDRKYIGIVFEINNHKYFVPLSSFKEKHDKMKETIDFIKIGNMAVINLNNMIPVPNSEVSYCDFEKEKDVKYKELLRNEYNICNSKREKIFNNASKLYEKVTVYNSFIAKRCCNFLLLENKANEYELQHSTYLEVAASKANEVNKDYGYLRVNKDQLDKLLKSNLKIAYAKSEQIENKYNIKFNNHDKELINKIIHENVKTIER